MGKKDIGLKEYLALPEVFADLFNGYLFKGKQKLDAKKLIALDSTSAVHLKDAYIEEYIQKHRDVIKKGFLGREYVILGAENQTEVHYTMPVRSMSYDSLNYLEQILEAARKNKKAGNLKSSEFLSGFRKTDKILPVITLVVYYGSDKWNGGMDLYDMFGLTEEDEHLKAYIPNYKINLLTVCDLENPEMFQTGLRELFGVLKNRKNGNDLEYYVQNNKERFQNLDDDTFKVIGTMININEKLTLERDRFRNEKGGLDMCQAIRDIENRGESRGEERGENKMADLIKRLQIDSRIDDLNKSLVDKNHRIKLYKEYNIQ